MPIQLSRSADRLEVYQKSSPGMRVGASLVFAVIALVTGCVAWAALSAGYYCLGVFFSAVALFCVLLIALFFRVGSPVFVADKSVNKLLSYGDTLCCIDDIGAVVEEQGKRRHHADIHAVSVKLTDGTAIQLYDFLDVVDARSAANCLAEYLSVPVSVESWSVDSPAQQGRPPVVQSNPLFTIPGDLRHNDPELILCPDCNTVLCSRSTQTPFHESDRRSSSDARRTYQFCPACTQIECFVQHCTRKAIETVHHTVTIKKGRSKYAGSITYESDNCFCEQHAKSIRRFQSIDTWFSLPMIIGLGLLILLGLINLLGITFPVDTGLAWGISLLLLFGGFGLWALARSIIEGLLVLRGLTKKKQFVDLFWDPVAEVYVDDTGFL